MNQEHMQSSLSPERRPRMSEGESLKRVRFDNQEERKRLLALREKQPLKNMGNVGLAEEQELENIDKAYAEFVMNAEFEMRKLVDFAVLARQEVLSGENIDDSLDEKLLARLFEFYMNNAELLEAMEDRIRQKKKETPELFS